jgi:hypothetical protein
LDDRSFGWSNGMDVTETAPRAEAGIRGNSASHGVPGIAVTVFYWFDSRSM